MTNWHYFNENREKIGPITGKELKHLAQHGVITPETFVEDPNGRTGLAKAVKGLTFPETVSPEPDELFIAATPPPTQTAQAEPVPPPVVKQFFCTNCGNAVAEQAVACMSCGAKPVGHKKFCRQCATTLNPEQVICVKCGSAINASGVDIAGWMQSTVQSLGGGTNQATNFLKANNIMIGEIVIFASVALALLSFVLPWVEITIPLVGKLSRNGFSTYAFCLGLAFIPSVWMALAKRRDIYSLIIGYACAIAGFSYGIAYPFGIIEWEIRELEWGREAARELAAVGAGGYLFVSACIVLFVGIVLQHRAIPPIIRSPELNTLNTGFRVCWITMITCCASAALWLVFVVLLIIALVSLEGTSAKMPPVVAVLSFVVWISSIVAQSAGLIAIITNSVFLYQLWKLIPADIARTTPGKAVGFCFIPIFNFYWLSVAFKGLSEDMNKTLQRYGIQYRVNGGLGLCILNILVTIFSCGSLFLLPHVVMVYFLKSAKDGAVALLEHGEIVVHEPEV